jgi:hypothetical protein
VTSDAFRKLALSLPDAEERAHLKHPDFRVNKRIFATLGYPKPGWAMVALRPEDQQIFLKLQPEAFVAVKGKWGERGATNVILKSASVRLVREALEAAHDAKLSS